MSWKYVYQTDDKQFKKGWFKDELDWYYFNDDGIMLTDWIEVEGKWYYLNEDGKMLIGWFKYKNDWYYLEPQSTGFKGSAYCNCSKIIDGKEYSFDDKCKMIDNSLVSDYCVDFIKSYEGFYPNSYICPAGVPTIGYGTIKKEYVALGTCTKQEATKWLKEEVEEMAKNINKDLKNKNVNLKQHEFDSLCSFAYNCGTGALFGSTLYRRICEGVRDSSLKENFTVWNKANGKTLQGLLNRRIEEYDMFSKADYTRHL